MKILVVRLGALGDIVHTLPAVAALRRAYPVAQIDWLVDQRYRDVLDLVRGIDARITVEPSRRWRELPAVIRRLRAERYDVAFDFQGLLKSAVLARLSGANRVIGFERRALREPHAAVFYREHRSIPRGQHVIQKNLGLAAVLGVDTSVIEFPLDVPAGPEADGPYVLLNPGAAWPNKRWPPARFGELAAWLRRRYGLVSIVLWGPGEHDLAHEVVEASGDAARAAPPTTVGDVLALARGARLLVSGDTGPLHLAAAVGTPILGLYGPTSPARNGPWREKDVAISRHRQCVCHYRRHCLHRVQRPCLEHITVVAVCGAIEQRLLGR
jgi:lipopolysaccharide heptosyltransferase I